MELVWVELTDNLTNKLDIYVLGGKYTSRPPKIFDP